MGDWVVTVGEVGVGGEGSVGRGTLALVSLTLDRRSCARRATRRLSRRSLATGSAGRDGERWLRYASTAAVKEASRGRHGGAAILGASAGRAR